jgi:hypothetical protein
LCLTDFSGEIGFRLPSSRHAKFLDLSITLRLLIALLAATPVLAIAEGAFAQHLITFVAAFMLAVAAMAPQAEITATIQVLRRFSFAILFPVFFMILQLSPVPFTSLVNPIWPTASAALNESSLWGHVSIDPESTFRSLMFYVSILSLMVATIIVTKDRRKAETTLYVLSAVTTFMSAEVLLNQLSSLAGIISIATGATTFVAMSALGALANTATIIMAVERHLGRRELEGSSSGVLFLGLILGLAGIAICLVAMRTLAPTNVVIATAFGLAVMLFIAIVRRFALSPWSSAILFAILVVMAVGIIIVRSQSNPSAGILGFATSATEQSLAVAQRALSDSRWLGSGVGTFGSLAGVYQDFGSTPVFEAPTTAVSIAIEWGWPALVILTGFAIQLFAFTFRGALRRGRDSFYPAAAAAGVAVVFCEAFCDPSLMHPTVAIITAVVVGLGLSQSAGRTSGL